ncbi:MAG TPA: hypothetical protein VD736_06770 [Nitrososphaera sp.]|nr:hypothetical protein [Nitrososphaera sp.]
MAKNICVCCHGLYDTARDTTFEQRIVGDEDFCSMCWNEIMTTEYAIDFTLPQP